MSDRGKRRARRPVRPPSRLAEGADVSAELSTSSSSSSDEERRSAGAGAGKRGRLPAEQQHPYVYRFLTTRDITSDLAGETVFVLWPDDGTWYAAVVAKVSVKKKRKAIDG